MASSAIRMAFSPPQHELVFGFDYVISVILGMQPINIYRQNSAIFIEHTPTHIFQPICIDFMGLKESFHITKLNNLKVIK